MSFELSATNLTDTSVSLVMTLTSDYESDATISFSFQQGGSSGQTVYTTSAIIPSGSHTGDNITTNVDNQLTASTTYYVAATSGGALLDDVTITTKATGYNDPRTATQEQWEDLATKVNSKAEIGSVLSTPSDVAYVNSNNIISNAVTTGKIANGAVTADKINFNAFSTKLAGYSAEDYNLTTSYQDMSTIPNVPAGTYLAMFDCGIHQTTGSTKNIVARVDTSTDGHIDIGVFNTLTESVSYWNHLCGFCLFTVSNLATVKLQFQGETSWSMRQTYGRFLITRIG